MARAYMFAQMEDFLTDQPYAHLKALNTTLKQLHAVQAVMRVIREQVLAQSVANELMMNSALEWYALGLTSGHMLVQYARHRAAQDADSKYTGPRQDNMIRDATARRDAVRKRIQAVEDIVHKLVPQTAAASSDAHAGRQYPGHF